MFRNTIWYAISLTSIAAHYAYSYRTTREVENDIAEPAVVLHRAIYNYNAPPGSTLLQNIFNHVWTHLWNVGYWSTQYDFDVGNESQATYDHRQQLDAIQGAHDAMVQLWYVAKAVC